MPETIKEKLGQASVGIAGLGGLGSTVAAALARTGIGKLVIADFDRVDSSNLNRQQYFTNQIGQPKVDTTIENLRRINPDVKVEGHCERLNPDNIPEVFGGVDIIAECFDTAQEKQMLVETVLSRMEGLIIVSASGLAGYGNSNAIETKRLSKRHILVGDGVSGIDSSGVLTAGRVWIAAAHQANAIVEVIVDEIKSDV
jgi:sulfur carrier protein ThiS adenylyltransferase